MHKEINRIEETLGHVAQRMDWSQAFNVRGVVRKVGDGVAEVTGLESVGYEELLRFDSGALGMAYDLGANGTGVILLTQPDSVSEGEGVQGEQRLPELPVSKTLGRVIDPLGRPLDEGGPLDEHPTLPLFRPAPEIIERKSVDETLWTGVLAIDAAIPVGRGQRQLIVGDRNVGKTALAIDIVAAQMPGDVACIYVVIGQPLSRVLTLRQTLEYAGCLQNTTIIAADAASPPGLQYLAPYAGASLAEHYREGGQHALVVYDDLTKHADAYRELALLLNRPPGREAYPGDIFFVHAELLERATASSSGGSVTAFPIIETTDGDISSYIPTNLISITDGQIYLDSVRFERNQRPAIDVGRSVSRIGGVAQSPRMRKASKNLKILLSRFESLESLSRVGLEMDVGMQETMHRGVVLRELLRQGRLQNRDLFEQTVALTALTKDWFQEIPRQQIQRFVKELCSRSRRQFPKLVEQIASGELLDSDWETPLEGLASSLKDNFSEMDS